MTRQRKSVPVRVEQGNSANSNFLHVCQDRGPNDNDNDIDTQRSPSNICQWPGLTGMSESYMTPRKSLLKLMGLAMLARCVLAHC